MTEVLPDAPEVRFPEFSGPWAVLKGGDAFGQRRERGAPGLPIYSVTIDRGLVPRDSLEREFAANAGGEEANLRAREDDIVYNMMRMWQGAMGRAPEECMVSPAYVVLTAKDGYSPRFFEHWFKRARSIYWLWAYSYGLTSDRLRLYYRDFTHVPMRAPVWDEQEKIADVLEAFDTRLRLLNKQRAELIRYKAGLSRRLFAAEARFRKADGSDYPEWIETTLGAVATFSKGKGIAREDVVEGGRTPCIRYGELYTAYGEVIDDVASHTNVAVAGLTLSRKDDVILPASGEVPLDMASAASVTRDGVALGGDINIIRSSLDGSFLAYLLRGPKRRDIGRLAQGNSVVHVYGHHLAKLKIRVPADIEEQRKIAGALKAVDSRINAVAARADATARYKAGLLQRMFV